MVNFFNELQYIYLVVDRLKYAFGYVDGRSLTPNSIERIILSKIKNVEITTDNGRKLEVKAIKIPKEKIVHFNDGTFVGLADTPIIQLIILFRIMRILEETLILYRITRAKRLLVIFLDVGLLDENESQARLSRLKKVLNEVLRFDPNKGTIYSFNQDLKLSNNLILPIYGKEDATRIQVIQGDRIGIEMESMTHYFHRLLNNMLTSHIFGEKKTGKEEQIEDAFKMFVRLYQEQMANSIRKLYYDILESWGLDTTNISIEIEFPSPDVNQELKLIDTILRRIMVVSQLIATLGVAVPPNWVVNYVFKDLTNVQLQELINYIERTQSETQGEFGYEQYLTPNQNQQPVQQQNPFVDLITQVGDSITTESEGGDNPLLQQANNLGVVGGNHSQLQNLLKVLDYGLRYLEIKSKSNEGSNSTK